VSAALSIFQIFNVDIFERFGLLYWHIGFEAVLDFFMGLILLKLNGFERSGRGMILLVGEIILLIIFGSNLFVGRSQALHLLHHLLKVAFFIAYALEFVCCVKTIKTVDALVIGN
jgi:hypothetical protein